jgi:hypothetical protein
MTRFLKRFNCAKSQTQPLTAGNNYSEDKLAEIFLTSAYSTSKPHHSIIITIHADKRNNGETMLFSKIETRFIKTGEMTIKRKQQTRQHSANLSSQKDLGTPSCKLNEAPFRGKVRASLRQVNNDYTHNRINTPPTRDPYKKLKCCTCGSLYHLLNESPKREEYIKKSPKKDRKPHPKHNLKEYISTATVVNATQYMEHFNEF